MSEVIDKIKTKYPAYANVPDEELALKVGAKYPAYLEQDPQFKQEFQAAAIGAGTKTATQGVAVLGSTLTNPAAGEAAEQGRAQAEAERRPKIELSPYQKYTLAGGEKVAGPFGPANPEEVLSLPGVLSAPAAAIEQTGIMQSIGDVVSDFLHRTGIDPSAEAGKSLVPEGKDKNYVAAGPSPLEEAFPGFAKGLENMFKSFVTPENAALLPVAGVRAVQLGFEAQMAAGIPDTVQKLAQAKTSEEFSEAGSQLIMQILAAKHGLKETPKPEVSDEIKTAAPQTAQELQKGAQADALHRQTTEVLQHVREQSEQRTEQVPTKAAEPEAGARSKPAGAEEGKTPAVKDYERYQELIAEMRSKPTAEERAKLFPELIEIQKRHGGYPPEEPETITHSAYRDEQGEVHLGANHPQILDELGIEGFEERESRNTPQFGYRTNKRPFIDRQEGGRVAQKFGQAKEPYAPGTQVHSDQILSSSDPSKSLGEAPAEPEPQPQAPPVGADEPAIVQAGAAYAGGLGGPAEIPVTGIGADVYGISQKIREERARAGQVDLTLPGESMRLEELVQMGRDINAADPEAPFKFLTQFENDPNKSTSTPMFASIRAHGEMLAQRMRQIEEQHGTESTEWEAARNAMSEWDRRTKAMSTQAHLQFKTHQGYTDLDTGSVGGLERERMRLTDKEFNPDEKKEAGRQATEVRQAEHTTDDLTEDLQKQLQEELEAVSPEDKAQRAKQEETTAIDESNKAAENLAKAEKDLAESVTPTERKAAEKEAQDAAEDLGKATAEAERVQRLKDTAVRKGVSMTEAEQRAFDAANKTVREMNIRAAQAENKARVKRAAMDREVAQVQRDAAQRAQDAADKVVRRAASEAAKAETKARVKAAERKVLDDQLKAAKRAQAAADKVVRNAAAAAAEAENKARVAKAQRDKEVAQIQLKAAQKAQDAAWKQAREAATRAAKLERKILGDPSIPVWQRAKKYLFTYEGTLAGAGEGGRKVPRAISFDDLRNHIATDLGLPVDKVTKLLSSSKRMKKLTNDLWIAQQRERNLKTKARLWVQGLDMPAYEKFLKAIPRTLFQIRVGFHGTVALGTHAPALVYDPRFWKTYAENYGKMYRMVTSPAFYEAEMQNLLRRENFVRAMRAGLVVDPFKYEGFDRGGFVSEQMDKMTKAISKATGLPEGAFSGMGERGYSVLKTLRMDMFDQFWDALPDSKKNDAMAAAISDKVNHITGVVTHPSGTVAEYLLFAPKLAMSRVAVLAGDPIRAARTGIRMATSAIAGAAGVPKWKLPEVTPAEKWFAAEELKSKMIMASTYVGLLALNQGILSASGSKQEINFTDPFKSDWLKFKAAGSTISYGNPLLTMIRMPIRLGSFYMMPDHKIARMVYPDEAASTMIGEYFRSQLGPAASLSADLLMREDWMKRQIDFGFMASERPEPKRLQAQGIEPYTPLEYWGQQALFIPGQELMRSVLHGDQGIGKDVMDILFMMGTGARISADPDAQ